MEIQIADIPAAQTFQKLHWCHFPVMEHFDGTCFNRGLQIDAQGNLHWLVYVAPGTYADGAFVKVNDGQFRYVFKYDAAGNFLGPPIIIKPEVSEGALP